MMKTVLPIASNPLNRREKNMSVLVPRERIEQAILLICGHRVMLSTDRADFYAVEPRFFIQAVQCYPACCEASALFKSTLASCGRVFAFEK
jgi:hypothetical protein